MLTRCRSFRECAEKISKNTRIEQKKGIFLANHGVHVHDKRKMSVSPKKYWACIIR